MVRVALSGPALEVRMNTMSNVCSELMNAMTDEKKTMGDKSGNLIRKNSVNTPAPSILAASTTDGEMFCSPARKIITFKPTDDQIVTMHTARSARLGSPSQSGAGT